LKQALEFVKKNKSEKLPVSRFSYAVVEDLTVVVNVEDTPVAGATVFDIFGVFFKFADLAGICAPNGTNPVLEVV